ncbi:MAG: zinc finger-like domain-containing protein, partial [Sedimentisphaerales bacterium]|nr:zinc finger-like domain-containing protein [Sedimentisphaerales bacterium]
QEDASPENIPVLEALDDLPDDFLDSIEPDIDRPAGEPEQESDDDDQDVPSSRLTPDKILGYVLAIIPIIALIIFISFLFSTDKKENTDEQLISEEDIALIEKANKGNISEAIKNQVVESGFTAQTIPDNFLLMLDQLIASYSSGQDRLALLEDIAISLQAWQMIAGNISDTSAFSHILESQLYRNNNMAFDLSEQENDRLAYVLAASDSEVALAPAFYNSVMKSANTNQKRRIIELAGVSGTTALRDLMLDTLKGKEDPEISCRIVRAFCLWLNTSDQSELLTLVSSSRRDLSRRIFDNLNMRYASVLENTSLSERFLPGSFTRREIDICLKWWQENILSLGNAARPGQNASLAGAKSLPADEYAVLLAGIWKNSYILNAMLRSSVALPVMSPDMEINAGCELLIDQVLAESMAQVKSALLAVIYEKYAGDPLLKEIDLLRFGSREYDFIDADLRAQARANEILIYCKIMNGEKYESRKTLRYNPGSNTLLLVRDALFEAIKNYASSKLAVYQRQSQGFGDLMLEFDLDFELVGESEYHSGDENADDDLQKILAQLRADPFSQELYQKARMLSHNRDNVDSESLIYLQLGIKALANRKFGAGSAIAIDCFGKAMNYPLGRRILEHNMPSLVQALLEEPSFICSGCGNSGYVICPSCNGSMFVRCDACRGQGSVVDRTDGRQACYDCGGTGKLYCVDCNGSGVQRCVLCSEYISNIDLFLPDDQQLTKLQQAINHAALRYKIAITPIE